MKVKMICLGLVSCLIFSGPLYAREENTYTIVCDNEESLVEILEELYPSRWTYHSTQKEQILVYKAKKQKAYVKGLDLSKPGSQKVTFLLKKGSKKTVFKKETRTLNVRLPYPPTLQASQTQFQLQTHEMIDLSSYIQAFIQAFDGLGQSVPIEMEGNVDPHVPGEYVIMARCEDRWGQETSLELSVEVVGCMKSQKIFEAALEQLGDIQDCTMLVTRSLRAAGISFHGWPEEYFSLGQPTDTPVPGDLIIYQGHVAIYAGHGQAIHGGWNGSQTVLTRVECSQALLGYVHIV